MRRACLIVALMALAATPQASATKMEVETDGDDFGNPVTAGICTLREAVESARRNIAFGGCPKGSKRKRDTIKLIGNTFLTIDGQGPANSAGDLDFTGGGKLTIRGSSAPDPDPPAIVQDGSDRILEITRQRGVKIQGVEMNGGDNVAAGGAVRVAKRAQVTFSDVQLHDNEADSRGGAVACEGCRSLRLQGAFRLFENSVIGGAGSVAGGGLWSNAPTTMVGDVGASGFQFTQAWIFENNVVPGAGEEGTGGGIHVADDLSVRDALIANNTVFGAGRGGGVAMHGEPGERLDMTLTEVTVDGNEAPGAGGGIDLDRDDPATDLRLSLLRSAVTANENPGFPAGNASGGGISAEGNATIVDSVVDGNSITGGSNTYGGGIHTTQHPIDGPIGDTPVRLRLVRSSITANTISGGTSTRNGGGIYAAGTNLEATNTTITGNAAVGASGSGGGLLLTQSSNDLGSGRIEFSTIADNVAGGATGGDGIRLNFEPPLRLRASIVDQATNGCAVQSGGITSGGFNVEPGNDPDCGLDAATDTHSNPILPGLTENGSPAVGFGDPPPFGGAIIPRTNAFTNNSSAALDIVPPGKCRVSGKKLATDARGAPRPAEDGCDAGAIERTGCLGLFAAGPGSAIGTKGPDEINSSGLSIVVAQAGDDFISTYGGVDRVCAGSGDDVIMPGSGAGENDQISAGAGRDMLNYNNGGLGLFDLAAGTATGPNIGTDEFTSIEDIQSSEGADTVLGSNGRNRLIGGGDPDTIRGRGGIDVIDARDGEADVEIDCGPGKNSKEKALIDEGVDPAPQSC